MRFLKIIIGFFSFLSFNAFAQPADYLSCKNELLPSTKGTSFLVKVPNKEDTFYIVTKKTIVEKTFTPPGQNQRLYEAVDSNDVVTVHSAVYEIEPELTGVSDHSYVGVGWSKSISNTKLTESWGYSIPAKEIGAHKPIPLAGRTNLSANSKAIIVKELEKVIVQGSKFSSSSYQACSKIPELKPFLETHRDQFESSFFSRIKNKVMNGVK